MRPFVFVVVFVLCAASSVIAAEKNEWAQEGELVVDVGAGYAVTSLALGADETVYAAVQKVGGKTHDGKVVAITSEGRQEYELPERATWFGSIALDSTARRVYAIDYVHQCVRAWDMSERKLVVNDKLSEDIHHFVACTFKEGTSEQDSMVMAMDSVKANAVRKGIIRVRSGEQGAEQQFEIGGEVRGIAIAPTASFRDAYAVVISYAHVQSSGGNYGPYWVTFVGPRAPGQPWNRLARHKVPGAPYDVAVSPVDRTKVAVATFKGIVLMDRNSGKMTQLGSSSPVGKVLFLADGTLVTNGTDGLTRVWDITKTRPIAQFGTKGSPATVATALAAGNSYGSEFMAAIGSKVMRYKRQRSEGKPASGDAEGK